ncbi:hypothetical protein CCMSSC00406_0008450 [Pleurotus cornucopiae]|uniref:Uncharacterized protein n=1 Tax=Pleurotus cornucopiae TaxID=5321 RepID=A0ACB7J927_PLECO|nr:hypothetical protein CCMSSC00406_0008450 [Pleurotus cornucopiae]
MEAPPRSFIQETYREKALRKFNENPWVPLGVVATCGALITAMVKMRQGDSRSFNRWLRVRVIAQGLTVAAMVGGTYTLGSKNRQSVKEIEEQERLKRAEEKREEDRKAFEERLKEAEEAYEVEKAFEEKRHGAQGSEQSHSWSSWFGGGSKGGSS